MRIGGWSDYETMRKHYKKIARSDSKKHTDALKSFFNKECQPDVDTATMATKDA